MTELAQELLGFAVKSGLIFLTIVASTAAVVFLVRRVRRASSGRGWLEVKHLNERFDGLRDALQLGTTKGRAAFKALRKQQQALSKAAETLSTTKPSVYVVDFDGDILATATSSLREEVTAIIGVAKPEDEVVVRLESGGGAVPHYGLAAAQLVRLKEKKLKVTVCIDRVAASGGYMMACVADQVVAAPFSIIGSIGVVAQVPNVHRFLKRYDVDVEEMTAGEFKRTVSLLGEVTEKGKAKLQEQLEETHGLFKAFVKQHRPALDVDQVATGEYWLGTRAKELKLVDTLVTSDDYLVGRAKDSNVFQVHFHGANPWRERLMGAGGELLERAVLRLLQRAQETRLQ
ncbi:MAG: protease SohB [Myxococcaceae bacterium]|jgi:serine protease SohB|nr:protease SohB [Myxococcaceae bacterium]